MLYCIRWKKGKRKTENDRNWKMDSRTGRITVLGGCECEVCCLWILPLSCTIKVISRSFHLNGLCTGDCFSPITTVPEKYQSLFFILTQLLRWCYAIFPSFQVFFSEDHTPTATSVTPGSDQNWRAKQMSLAEYTHNQKMQERREECLPYIQLFYYPPKKQKLKHGDFPFCRIQLLHKSSLNNHKVFVLYS